MTERLIKSKLNHRDKTASCRKRIMAIEFASGISRPRCDVHADFASRKQINRGWRRERIEGRKVGRARARFISRREIRSITRPRINYEFNATEAACDRKLFGTDLHAN